MTTLIKFVKKYYKLMLQVLATILVAFIPFIIYKIFDNGKTKPSIEYIDSTGTYNKIYTDGTFNDLKKENKALYDSLKAYKDEIDFLVHFKYDKDYNTGKVITNNTVTKEIVYVKDEDGNYKEVIEEPVTYEYQNKPNDSIEYKLKINSLKEPNWYSLNVHVKDNITIVNKDKGDGNNQITIKTDNNADVSNTTVFKKKEKKNIFNKIAIGPTIGYGYTFKSKKLEPYIGISVTYNIFGTK